MRDVRPATAEEMRRLAKDIPDPAARRTLLNIAAEVSTTCGPGLGDTVERGGMKLLR
jgi:hypothetical protein